jgi:putative MATE family efflux protein
MEKVRHLGEERVMKLILRYSTPAIAGMVIYGLNRIVGNIFIGKFLGQSAMAGFTVANSLVMINLGFIMLVGTGSSALISIFLGKKETGRAQATLGTAITFGFALSVAIAAIGEAFTAPLLRVFGGEGESLAYGAEFISVYLLGNVFQFWNTTFNSAMRAEGQPGKALLTNVVSFVANTALTPVFIFVIPMGMRGIAMANILSQFIVALWLCAHFFGKKTILPLAPRAFVPDLSLTIRLVSIGIAPFFMQFLGASMSIVTNHIVRNLAGDLGLAVAGAVFSVYFLLIMPLQGTSVGIQPIIGYNFGAALHHRVRKTVIASIAFTACICVVEAAVAIAFRSRLGGLFTNGDEGLIALCSQGLLLILLAFPIAGIQFVGSSLFLGTGKSLYALIVNLFRSLFVLLPILVLPGLMGIAGLFLSYPVTDVVVSVLCVLLMRDAIMPQKGTVRVPIDR